MPIRDGSPHYDVLHVGKDFPDRDPNDVYATNQLNIPKN